MTPDEPEEGAEQEYESGPFCVHWSDPSDCDEECLRVGCLHPCKGHNNGCTVTGCECTGIVWERNGEKLGE